MRKIKQEFIDNNLGISPEVEEYPSPIDLTIHTKAPGKWLLIDMETGQKYIGLPQPSEYGKWLRLDKDTIE